VFRAAEGADVIVNLAGVRLHSDRQRFIDVNATGAGNVAEAASFLGAGILVHISALEADADAKSAYARSRTLGEDEVRKAFPGAVILRPSLVFGHNDRFFNFYGEIACISPVVPVIGGTSLIQPVYVGDVAAAIAAAVDGAAQPGTVYELGGPEIAAKRALIGRVLDETGRKRVLVPVAPFMATVLGGRARLTPLGFLSPDRAVWLRSDLIVADAAIAGKRTLAGLGIAATSMDVILPAYLWRFRRHGQFDRIGT